jgi:hypothetical protein
MDERHPALSLTVSRETHDASTRLLEYVGEPHDETAVHTLVAHVEQLVAMDREATRVRVVLARRVIDRLLVLFRALEQTAPHFSLSVH